MQTEENTVFVPEETPRAEQPTTTPTESVDLVGRIVDHLTTTKKMMIENGAPFESMVPLVTLKKSMDTETLQKLYAVISKDAAPFEEDEYPFYTKNASGEMIEGTQVDKYYKTKIADVKVVEAWDKTNNKLLESHIVIGPISK